MAESSVHSLTELVRASPNSNDSRKMMGRAASTTELDLTLFDFSDPNKSVDKKQLKEQVMSSSPFAEALKAQDEMKDAAKPVIYRPHYISKRKEGEITREHEQYNLTYAMMIGIRYSVQTWNPASESVVTRHRTLGNVSVKDMKSGVTLEHFFKEHKTYFPPEGRQNVENPLLRTPAHLLKGGFKFKDYASEIFGRLRKRFDIDDQSYLDSLCGSFNFLEFISNSKSGEFFFYSHDGRFMIKTQKRKESKFMLGLLPAYFNYVADHPNSLLVRICGAHRVKMPHLRRKMHFVIMMSVFAETTETKPVNRIYDLKGATVGRRANEGETVKKDQDILAEKTKFQLGRKKKDFLDQLESDSKFLASVGVMDYSLLVGIHDGLLKKRSTLTPMAGSFIFRSDRKSNLGFSSNNLNSSSSTMVLMNDGSSLQDPSGMYTPPSLPTTFSKNQIARQQQAVDTMPQISETKSSPRHSSLQDKATELSALRVAALSDSASFRLLTHVPSKDNFNSFYKIEIGLNTYHMGIIDIFTKYSNYKRGEHLYKAIRTGKGDDISAVNPRYYQKRFMTFISELTMD